MYRSRSRQISLCALFLLCTGLLYSGCKKRSDADNDNVTPGNNNNGNNNNNQGTLTDYKNGKHRIFVGFLVGDGNDPYDGYNPANAPDSLDYLEFFAGRDTVTAHWRAAQAKGTRIVVCHFIKDAYFDGSVNDPATQEAGYVAPPGFDPEHATAASTYDHWARDMYNKEVVLQGLDGIDLDIESSTFGGDVPRTAANGTAVMRSVAKYYGPNCTECQPQPDGKKPAFFYDTDGTGGFEQQMYSALKDNYTYVLFQSYTTGNHAWPGTGTGSFGSLVDLYGKEKLIFLVNGDSFVHADGSEDQPGSDGKATADLYAYAQWIKDNQAAGVGAYRMSRDYNHKPAFAASRKAIQIMNAP